MLQHLGRRAPEIIAGTAACGVLIAGVALALSDDPLWLNRAGSLIIVIGVVLAASRFHEWIQQQVGRFLDENLDEIASDAAANLANVDVLSPAQHQQLKAKVRIAVESKLSATLEHDKRRLRASEVFLVVLGTVLNGFGDWLVQWLAT